MPDLELFNTGLNGVKNISQSAYERLDPPNSKTLYIVSDGQAARAYLGSIQIGATGGGAKYGAIISETPTNFSMKTNCTKIIVPEECSSIEANACEGMSGLTIITLPENLNSIGDKAFINCSSLNIIDIPNNNLSFGEKVFEGCSSLTSLTLPDNLNILDFDQALADTSGRNNGARWYSPIMNGLFKNCSSLENINLPTNLWFISSEMFMNTNLDESILTDNIYGIESYGLSGTEIENFSVPDSAETEHTIEYIGDYAFKDCKSLTTADLTHLGEVLKGYYRVSGTNTTYNTVKGMFSGCNLLETVQMPESANWNKNNKGTIGQEMFDGCSSLENINLVCQETSVGFYAFRNCSSLRTLTDENHYVSPNTSSFEGCSSLTSIRTYAPSKKVPESCFKNNNSLQSVEILYTGSAAITFNNDSFANCSSLTTITFPSNMTKLTVGSRALSGCSSLTGPVFEGIVFDSIGAEGFKNCSNLDYIDISSLTLNQSMFEGCEKLHGDTAQSNTLTIKKLSTIPSKVFMGCEALTSLAFTGTTTITTLGTSCFEGCSSLTSLPAEITSTFTTINPRAFYGCQSMEAFTCGNSLKSLTDEVFYNCRKLKSFTAPAANTALTTIGVKCFYDCFDLESISFPKATTIYQEAFHSCVSLETVDLPLVTTIYDRAFSGCTALTTFPNLPKLKYLYAEAFFGSGLEEVDWSGMTTTFSILQDKVFGNCQNLRTFKFHPTIGNVAIPPNFFIGCENITIYVSREETANDEANKPWGAENATVIFGAYT